LSKRGNFHIFLLKMPTKIFAFICEMEKWENKTALTKHSLSLLSKFAILTRTTKTQCKYYIILYAGECVCVRFFFSVIIIDKL
jgi:hypothetical protein